MTEAAVELSALQAAEILSVTKMTVSRWVDAGLLPADRVGLMREIRIKPEELRQFAERYNYRWSDSAAEKYVQQ